MTTSTYTLVNKVVDILNTYGYDPLPSSERAGSMWFKPAQDIVFTRQMPKGKVYHDTTSRPDKERSFGYGFEDTKIIIINCVIFTKKGDKDPTLGIKDRELCEYLVTNAHDVLKTRDTGIAILHEFGETSEPLFDEENQVFVGKLPVLFKIRE